MTYGDISEFAEISRINGNLQRGGWEMRFKALRDTDLVGVNQRTVLDWYGMFGTGTPESTARRAFDGYVMPLKFTFDRTGSIADMLAQTTDGFLRRGWLQGLGLADTDTDPRDHYHQWDSVTGGGERMTMGRIVRHILGYYDTLGAPPATNPDWVAHTNLVYHATQNPNGWVDLSNVTVTPFADPGNPDGTMRVDRYIVRETNNIWTSLQEIAKNEFFVIYCDKANNLYYVRHPMYATVLPAPVMTFDEDFLIGKPTVQVRATDQIRQVRLGAVTDSGDTIRRNYPVSPTFVYGNRYDYFRLRCNDADTLSEWARVKYLFDNRDFTVKWTAPGLCGLLFDILDRVQVTYAGTTANGVHVVWYLKKFWIHDITVTPDKAHSGTSVFTLEAESA
jgi:hypothetical protein